MPNGQKSKFLHICSNLQTRKSNNCLECKRKVRHYPTKLEVVKLNSCCFDTSDFAKAFTMYSHYRVSKETLMTKTNHCNISPRHQCRNMHIYERKMLNQSCVRNTKLSRVSKNGAHFSNLRVILSGVSKRSLIRSEFV